MGSIKAAESKSGERGGSELAFKNPGVYVCAHLLSVGWPRGHVMCVFGLFRSICDPIHTQALHTQVSHGPYSSAGQAFGLQPPGLTARLTLLRLQLGLHPHIPSPDASAPLGSLLPSE